MLARYICHELYPSFCVSIKKAKDIIMQPTLSDSLEALVV